MTGSDNRVQRFLDQHGALIGIAGLGLALVFAVLWLSSSDGSSNVVSTGTSITTLPSAATLPELPVSTSVAPDATAPSDTAQITPIQSEGSLVAVKIDNAPGARPQVGLGLATTVVEMPVEGGITRFTAFFTAGDDAPIVSPIRSLRWTDVLFIPLFSDVVVTTGGRSYIEGAITSEGVEVFNLSSSHLVQNGGQAPYDVEASVADIPGGASKTPFAAGANLDEGTRPEVIEIPFSSVEMVEWRWEGGRFVRYSNDAPHMVREVPGGDEQRFARDAILVLKVVQRSAGYTDSAGADVPIFDLIGTGEALLATEDGMVEGVWIRLSKDDPFTILNAGGEPIMVPLEGLLISLVPRFVEISTR